MKYYIGTIIVIVFLTVISSCTAVQEATVFDRTVSYYREQGDTLKMRAAEYLRDNAKWHYGVPRLFSKPLNDDYKNFMAFPESKSDSVFQAYLDSIGLFLVEFNPIIDYDSVNSDFVCRNIDLAFDSWHKPWSRDVSFNDFCKYILPYRNSDELLSEWRSYFKQRYEPTIVDSVADPTSLYDVVKYLMRCIRRDVEYGGSMGLFNRRLLTHDQMMKLHWLDCKSCAHFTTLAMRACGVPCSMIEINWRFTEVKHYSVLFPAIGSNKRAFRLSVGDTLIYMGAPKDSMAAWRVWEQDYELNKSKLNLYHYYKDNRFIAPAFFESFTQSDVTNLMCKTFNFSVPVPDSLRNERYLFLCRFHNWRWIPVREGIVMSDSVYFNNATIRQWYRLGFADSDTIKTFGDAFTIIGNEDISNISNRIRPYNLTGDSILFRLAYRDNVCDTVLNRKILTYYWNSNQWTPVEGNAVLWGYNPHTNEYKIFDDSMRNSDFRADFYLFDISLPRWTVFYDKILGSPYGFIKPDDDTGEACLMQF